MPELSTIYDYMRRHAALLGDRILQEYPALHQFEDAVSPRIEGLLRKPFPAQTIRQGRIVRKGRFHVEHTAAQGFTEFPKRWLSLCGDHRYLSSGVSVPSWVTSRRHAYRYPVLGPYVGCIVNSDTGKPLIVDDSRLTAAEFEKVKIARPSRPGRELFAAHCTAHCGRRTRTRSAAWLRLIHRAHMPNGLTMRFATRFTNWLAIPRKEIPCATLSPHAPTDRGPDRHRSSSATQTIYLTLSSVSKREG